MGTSGLGIHNSLTGVVLSWFFFNDTLATFLYDMKTCQNLLLPKAFFEGQMRNINLLLAKRNSWRAVQVEQNQDKLNYSYLSKFKWCTEYFTDNFFVDCEALLFTFCRSWEIEKILWTSLTFLRCFTKKKERKSLNIFFWFFFKSDL